MNKASRVIILILYVLFTTYKFTVKDLTDAQTHCVKKLIWKECVRSFCDSIFYAPKGIVVGRVKLLVFCCILFFLSVLQFIDE